MQRKNLIWLLEGLAIWQAPDVRFPSLFSVIKAFPASAIRLRYSADRYRTHPRNFKAVTAGGRLCPAILTFIVLMVRNSHCAFSPSGVPSAVHVRRVIEPSGPPVARTPRCEYSRSWKAMDVIEGTRGENEDVFVRSKVAIGRPLMVCRQSLRREHVAM